MLCNGCSYKEQPQCLQNCYDTLHGSGCIKQWGRLESKEEYLLALRDADVAVSTAIHEFYGVSMLEAAIFGKCFILAPNRLAYPEIYPRECLYNTERQLFKKLKDACRRPEKLRRAACNFSASFPAELYLWRTLKFEYRALLSPRQSAPAGQRQSPAHGDESQGRPPKRKAQVDYSWVVTWDDVLPSILHGLGSVVLALLLINYTFGIVDVHSLFQADKH